MPNITLLTPERMQFTDRLFDLLRAGYPILLLQTHEYDRAYAFLKEYCRKEDSLLYHWNSTDGLGEMGLNFDSILPVGDNIYEPTLVLEEVERRLDTREHEIYVLEGMADHLHFPNVKVFLRKLALNIPKGMGRKHVVLLGPMGNVPQELARFIAVVEMPFPDYSEMAAILDKAISAAGATVEDGLRHELVKAADGLTAHEAGMAYRLAGVRDNFGHRALESVREAFLLHPKTKGE